MKLIVGLGNPGREYEHTRHNAGFDVLDRLADLLNTGISQSKFNALITTVRTGQETILLMKPQTYMNNSGEAVIQAVQFYKIPVDQILVIHDDLDLPVGKIRIRTSGSAGGLLSFQNKNGKRGKVFVAAFFKRLRGVGQRPTTESKAQLCGKRVQV